MNKLRNSFLIILIVGIIGGLIYYKKSKEDSDYAWPWHDGMVE